MTISSGQFVDMWAAALGLAKYLLESLLTQLMDSILKGELYKLV